MEALLGQGNALDEYHRALGEQDVRCQTLENDLIELQARREVLGQEIVEENDESAAEIYSEIFGAPTEEGEPGEDGR